MADEIPQGQNSVKISVDIITKIKRLFNKPWTDALAADVTFYPNKIIVQTFDYTDGPSIGSTKLTILPVDTSPDILGRTLRKHFNLTEHGLKYQQNKDAWNAYKEAAGFKTNKDTYKDARQVMCRQSNNEIILTPTENLYNTGYEHLPNLDIKLPLTIPDEELGLQLTKARDLSNG